MRPDSGYYRGVLRGIKSYADQARNWVFGMAARTNDLLLMVQTWRPAGALAFVYSDEMPHLLGTLGIPVVSFANTDESIHLPMVGVDDLAVGEMAARHLLERGFQHFAFVGCSKFAFSNQREVGFKKTLAEFGFDCDSHHDPHPLDAASVWAWTAEPRLRQWLLQLPRPCGVFAANDSMGLRISDICRQSGLRIPEDIALLGVDDDDLFCGLAHPPLSSVKTPLERIGYEAAKMLAHLIAGGEPPKEPLLFSPMHVVTRNSTDVLAIADPDLAAAVRFIHQNAHRPIGIKQLLDDIGLSRRSLERKFQAVYKRSPFEELLRVRLQRAKDLLSGTDLPMSIVAEQSGFGTGKQLSMTFQKRLGMTPTTYRRQYRVHS